MSPTTPTKGASTANTHATPVVQGRRRAEAPPGSVVFLIGMRINKLTKLGQWGRVFVTMPRLVAELEAHPEMGLLSAQTYLSGRTVMLVQYWRDAESLQQYARSRDQQHLPAWRRFNQRVAHSGDVGIFHETYVIGEHENVYVNMPAGYGLAGALGRLGRGQAPSASTGPGD